MPYKPYKPELPYLRLIREARQWIARAVCPERKLMWSYTKDTVLDGKEYPLSSLSQRVKAADQLGWDVRLRWTEEGLLVEYVQRPPAMPDWYAVTSDGNRTLEEA